MDLSFWANWGTIAQGVGSILSVLLTGYVAVSVHKYTSRRDVSEFIGTRWEQQQQLNLHNLGHPDDLKVFEQIVYGKQAPIDLNQSRKMFHLFHYLNQMHHYYVLLRRDFISKQEFEKLVAPTARLICREKALIAYIFEHRGYDDEFGREVLPIIENSDPIMVLPPPGAC